MGSSRKLKIFHILLYALRCMIFQAVEAHGSVGKQHVSKSNDAGSNPTSATAVRQNFHPHSAEEARRKTSSVI